MRACAIWMMTLIAVVVLAKEAAAQHSRRTPITEAVAKARDSVLSLKVDKPDGRGRCLSTAGTAFLVDERGYAVTSCHVVSGAARIQATLPDGTQVKVRVLAEETPYDVALLKLESTRQFKPVILGSSSDLILGETVLAVGDALGMAQTVSRGILSGVGRHLSIPGHAKVSEKGLIQTDASINPGNSGGPLLNINGEVIGMTFAIRHDARGVAFAIPINTIKEILCRHLSARNLGGIDHALDFKEMVDPDSKEHVRVVLVRTAQSGFQAGDQITAVAGRTISSGFDLERALWECKPGQTVGVVLVRAGQKLEISLPLSAGHALAQAPR